MIYARVGTRSVLFPRGAHAATCLACAVVRWTNVRSRESRHGVSRTRAALEATTARAVRHVCADWPGPGAGVADDAWIVAVNRHGYLGAPGQMGARVAPMTVRSLRTMVDRTCRPTVHVPAAATDPDLTSACAAPAEAWRRGRSVDGETPVGARSTVDGVRARREALVRMATVNELLDRVEAGAESLTDRTRHLLD